MTYSYTLTVTNNPGVALPSTGGPGTTWLTLVGALLALAGLAGLVSRRRRAR
ncbi:MAG: LPXTG cell wall anchor domain-containing protein [Clostridia bacterium]|nr:LPXTG cell wall anchor domain-containing protein [Clostridia bacterium]